MNLCDGFASGLWAMHSASFSRGTDILANDVFFFLIDGYGISRIFMDIIELSFDVSGVCCLIFEYHRAGDMELLPLLHPLVACTVPQWKDSI